MKLFVTIIAIALVVVVGSVIYFQTTVPGPDDDQTENSASPDGNSTVVGTRASWPAFESEPLFGAVVFSLERPQAIEINEPQAGIYNFRYIGPNNEPNTEITDGFTFTVTGNTSTSLDDYVALQEASSNVEETTFNGYEARRFTTTSELDDTPISHLAVLVDGETTSHVIDITYNISSAPEDSARYQNTVDAMLASLTLRTLAADTDSQVQINSPNENETITSPVTVSGEAPGTWYFEGILTIDVIDESGTELGSETAEAEGEWMTEDLVPFSTTISYDASETADDTGSVVLRKANPSGLPENADSVSVSVSFGENQ